MYLHEPSDYRCPFCNIVAGGEEPRTVIWRDDLTIAFLALHQQPNNVGSIILCPVQHFENIYVLPEALGTHMFGVTQKLAVAIKMALQCQGVSTRQHNEPAGGQDVWHYHVHVVPRFNNDHHYTEAGSVMSVQQRVQFAERIRAALAESAA